MNDGRSQPGCALVNVMSSALSLLSGLSDLAGTAASGQCTFVLHFVMLYPVMSRYLYVNTNCTVVYQVSFPRSISVYHGYLYPRCLVYGIRTGEKLYLNNFSVSHHTCKHVTQEEYSEEFTWRVDRFGAIEPLT